MGKSALEKYLKHRNPEEISKLLNTLRLVSENNILALGALVPVLALIPGILDEFLAVASITIAAFGVILFRTYLRKNREKLLEKLEVGKDDGLIDEDTYSEAVKNLNTLTIAKK